MAGTTGLMPGAGLNKEDANYRQHEKCLSCIHFYGPNSCDVVQGNISPEAMCNRWEVKEQGEGKDGEFYQNEFNKGNKPQRDPDDTGAGFYKDTYNKSR